MLYRIFSCWQEGSGEDENLFFTEMIDSGRLSPTIHKFGGEFIHSGLSAE